MTTPDRTDAIARVLEGIHVSIGYRDDAGDDNWADGTLDMDERRTLIRAILATDDPAAVAAIAATLAERHPDALLDALTDAGVLKEDEHCAEAHAAHAEGDYKVYACSDFGYPCPPPRLVTVWREVSP